MKKIIKPAILLVFTVMLICATCVCSIAQEAAPVAYTVELSDGTVTEYGSAASFKEVVSAAPNGSIITLRSNIQLNSGGIYIWGTEQEHKNITIDLAGHGLYSTSKNLVSTMFGARDFATLNVTSSKPDAFLYMIDTDTNSSAGGNIFSSIGVNALINVGGCVSLKGERYPGSNISTYSSCLVDIRNTGTIGFNCDGGRHFANIADWLGFITPRSGNGTITIKNADILVDRNTSFIYSEESTPTVYLENCLIARLDGEAQPLFGQMLAHAIIKDCVTNYSLATSKTSSNGIVTLEGRNVFGMGLGFASELIGGAEGRINARVRGELQLVGGGKEFYRYDNAGTFNKLQQTLPELGSACTFVSFDETVGCTWQYDGTEKNERWVSGEEPIPPTEINRVGKDGMYKKGWLKVKSGDKEMIFKLTYVNDFDIKVKVGYENDSLCYLIYVPAFVFDDEYISYSTARVDGIGFTPDDWTETVIDGQRYYEYTTMDIDSEDIDRVVEISLPCDIPEGNRLVKTEGIYRINLSGYLRMVHANESAYSAEQMALVRELENRYFHSGN